MSRHTPAPWINDSMEFSAGWRCLVTAGDRQFDIADPRERHTDEEDFANACLITAAPDLLDSLRIVRDWMDDPSINAQCPFSAEVASAIRLAVAKAEDRS